ncbi:MAG: UvrD-helicase domain-containing protein, partial [Nitrospirae bacterium]|nr:UvrD-helicase domain-containing protein [Nitrospirota bacterium]
SIYAKCLGKYRMKKSARHCLDYNDLELMAYEAITKNPEWQNVLYSFDEHTDHILVDEFQDTSTLQWKIIDKLTEEWRSGLGAKREKGVEPTIFLVGDDKQSIYSFRGANVSIFKNAKKKLAEWLGEEYHFIEIKENYRSLPAIVDFVNALFERLMPKGLYDDYKVEYTPFGATRAGDGKVELLVLDNIGNTKENRKAEASVIARKIKELTGAYEIYEADGKRICGYGDAAILLRNRTHLSVFEDALQKENIPYVVVKGIGFYNSTEVGILRNILFLLIDSLDDYSLLNVLRSPLFGIGYDAILKITGEAVIDGMPAGYLLESLRTLSVKNPSPDIQKAAASIDRWLERAKDTRYSILLEEILAEAGAWRYLNEKQRYVNVKKFIKIIEDFEHNGLTGLEIREKLIKASGKSEEAKANVNTEGMDAVKIMTVHASKGLQFPVVFLPCLDEESRARGAGSIVLDEDEGGIVIAYEEDSNLRKKVSVFQRHRERLQDEEKRLFYVAITRAMDYLCMSGVRPASESKPPSGKLAYLNDAFNLDDMSGDGLPFKVERIGKEDTEKRGAGETERIKNKEFTHSPIHPFTHSPVFVEPLDYKPSAVWLDVTEEIEEIRKKHGDDWIVLGRAFHRIFEGMSKGIITRDNLEAKTTAVLKNEVLSDRNADKMKGIVLADMERLYEAGYAKDIIERMENSYSELPFILDTGNRIYKGRIDRVIIKSGQEDKIAYVYDYKTYPVSEKEIPDIVKKYSFQIDIYKKAVERLFAVKAKGYIFFTHELKIVET